MFQRLFETTMSIWYDRSQEFRTILLKKDPKLLTKKSTSTIKTSKVINLIKNQILPGINTLQKVLSDSKHDYLYTFETSERIKFDQSCSDSLKSNVQMIQNAETVLKMHLSDSSTSKNYSPDQVKFYTMVIKLVKNYFYKVSDNYRDLQMHFAKIKKFEQESKKIGVKKSVRYDESSMENSMRGYELNLDDSQNEQENNTATGGENFNDEVTQMQAEFNDMATEITEIAQTVEEIAKLSTRMTEQVDIQYEMVEQIGNNVTNANNDVMEGNMEIRNAIQNNASTRSAIIFFLFMSSFLLLSLDWYTDKFDF